MVHKLKTIKLSIFALHWYIQLLHGNSFQNLISEIIKYFSIVIALATKYKICTN